MASGPSRLQGNGWQANRVETFRKYCREQRKSFVLCQKLSACQWRWSSLIVSAPLAPSNYHYFFLFIFWSQSQNCFSVFCQNIRNQENIPINCGWNYLPQLTALCGMLIEETLFTRHLCRSYIHSMPCYGECWGYVMHLFWNRKCSMCTLDVLTLCRTTGIMMTAQRGNNNGGYNWISSD